MAGYADPKLLTTRADLARAIPGAVPLDLWGLSQRGLPRRAGDRDAVPMELPATKSSAP